MRGLRVFHLIILGLLGACLLSCNDKDNPKCPVCPGDSSVEPTLDNIWPNADSTAWTYAITQRQWPDSMTAGLYANAEDVPPAPAIDEIRDSLWVQDVGDSVHTVLGTYRLQFLGRVTTESGAEAQFLSDVVYAEADGSSSPPPTRAARRPSSDTWPRCARTSEPRCWPRG
jgi:hypothetical protein